ncbi:hypothetical protein CXG81DRAFT_13452, partial [Caulochytrium protostelioides]
MPKLLNSAFWLPVACGLASWMVGTLFPLLDVYRAQDPRPRQRHQDWSTVLRCLGAFIGLNYAALTMPWHDAPVVSISLSGMSIMQWLLFDLTLHGLVLATVSAACGTGMGWVLVRYGLYAFTEADFFGVRSWFPAIMWSGSLSLGCLAR